MTQSKMRRSILVALLLLMLVVACGNKNFNNYNVLEKALIAILEQNQEKKVITLLDRALKNKNEEAYNLAYVYLGNDGINFFDKYLGKSNGYAEYFKGLLMQTLEFSERDIVNIFEKSAKDGNAKAYYILGAMYQDKLEFNKAMEYFEKGKNKKEIYSTYSFNYLKNLMNEYKKVEELNKKMINNTISKEEKKELGKIVLEKFSNYTKSYDILKEFVSENYPPALYVKAKMLENENQIDEALKIYNNLYFDNEYYLAGFEIAYNLVNGDNKYDLARRVLEEIKVDDSLINGYRGFVYQKLNDISKAEMYYLKAVKANDIDIMMYLGQLYEQENLLKKAKDIYEKAYNLGSIKAGYSLAEVLEKMKSNKNNNTIKSNREAKKILERLAKSGDENSLIELSFYYKEKDKNVRNLNLLGATKFNGTALHNLGVYYYNKKNNKKAKIFLKAAKEYGYELEKEFEKYINEK